MNSNVSRRNLAKGAAWATPIVAATAAIPAYAASSSTPPATSCADQYTPDLYFTDGPLAASSTQTQLRQSIGTACFSIPVGTVVTATITNTGSRNGAYKASYSSAYTLSGPTTFTTIAAGASATVQFTLGQAVPAGSTMGVFTQYEKTSTYSVTYTFQLPAGYSDPASGNNVASYTF